MAAAFAQDDAALPRFRRVVIDADPPKQPYYKMVGDLTGDGNPEIVIAGSSGPLVMYTRPDWKKTVIAAGGYNGGVNGELADINGDGRLDIVMGGVVWFENPGSAGSAWKVHRIDDQRIHDVEVADLNGDGRLDVVCRDQSAFGRRGNEILVYHQQGSGSWKKDVLSCPHGEGLKVADLNGDGRPDIVIGAIWFQNAAGRWIERSYAPDWTELDVKVEVGDINGNGRSDVVVTPSELKGERYKVSWFESPADTSQLWKEHVVATEIECVIHALALGDFNRDGHVDIAYAEMHQGEDPDEVVVLFNAGRGAPWRKLVLDTAGSHDIVAADVTGDGALDLVGANHADVHPVVVWENQFAAKVSAAPSSAPLEKWTYVEVDSRRASRKFGLAMGDLNSDGQADIASGQYVYFNPGADLTGHWTRKELPAADLDALLTLDVNNNGRADLVAMDPRGDVFWLEAADNRATSWTSRKVGTMGKADHSISAQGYALGRIRPGDKPQIVLNVTGNLSYFEVPEKPAQTPWLRRLISSTTYKEDVAVADMDNDGHLDVITTLASDAVAWWRNPGTDAENWQMFEIGSVPGPIADRLKVGDVDSNGRLDVVVSAANGQADGLYLFEQPAAGPAAPNWPRRAVVTQGSTNSMDLADITGDGHLDIIAGEHRGSLTLAIWVNDGSGQFTRHIVDTGKESHLGARVFDLDGDGDLDIVSIAWDRFQHLHVWRNDTRPQSAGKTVP
jgi:hypothetical protein